MKLNMREIKWIRQSLYAHATKYKTSQNPDFLKYNDQLLKLHKKFRKWELKIEDKLEKRHDETTNIVMY